MTGISILRLLAIFATGVGIIAAYMALEKAEIAKEPPRDEERD